MEKDKAFSLYLLLQKKTTKFCQFSNTNERDLNKKNSAHLKSQQRNQFEMQDLSNSGTNLQS